MQATDHLTAGPLPHAPSCMGTMEDILSSAYLAHSCASAFKAAWQVVHAFAVTRSDGDALLRHLTASGTLAAALQSPLWAIEAATVRTLPAVAFSPCCFGLSIPRGTASPALFFKIDVTAIHVDRADVKL